MRLLYLTAMGAIDSGVLDAMEDSLAARCAVERIELPAPEFVFDARRGQYGSVAVLEMLNARRPAGPGKLLGVTGCDLFIPMLTFVFGQAQLGGAAGVVSLARLRQEFYGMPPDAALLTARARKEALHEAGHLFGLVHCGDRRCAMSLATNLRQVDAKGAGFCAECAAALDRRAPVPGSIER